jgi:hypothetical protein
MAATVDKDGSRLALRCAIDRLRHEEEEAACSYRRWREAVRESDLAWGNLAAVEDSYHTLQRKLAEIENSKEYRSLKTIDLAIAPPNTVRHRLFWGTFRRALRLCDDLRLCVQILHCISSGEPLQPGLKDICELRNLPAIGRQPSLRDSLRERGAQRSAPDPPAELAYRPGRWTLAERGSEAQTLNLLLLSPVHRTGSTLLQRICNARKETLIWGEHGAVLKRFAAVFSDIATFSVAGAAEREAYFGQGENPNLWIADMCPELDCVQQAVVDSARSLLNSLYGRYRSDHDILGFKEVQYGLAEAELLRRCYPNACLLLLVRNPLSVWASILKDWCPSLDEWIARYNDGVLGYCEFVKRDANCHLLRYEDVVAQEERTMEILGDRCKVSRRQISMVLDNKIGSSHGSLAIADRDTILEKCRQSMETLGFSDA